MLARRARGGDTAAAARLKRRPGQRSFAPGRGGEDMANNAWEKDRAAHELFEQGRAAFNEAQKEVDESLKEPTVRGQQERLLAALAWEWQAVEQMEAAIELLREGLPGRGWASTSVTSARTRIITTGRTSTTM